MFTNDSKKATVYYPNGYYGDMSKAVLASNSTLYMSEGLLTDQDKLMAMFLASCDRCPLMDVEGVTFFPFELVRKSFSADDQPMLDDIIDRIEREELLAAPVGEKN